MPLSEIVRMLAEQHGVPEEKLDSLEEGFASLEDKLLKNNPYLRALEVNTEENARLRHKEEVGEALARLIQERMEF